MGTDLLIVLALMLLNGVFAGAEIAVLTLRKTRLGELIDEKRAGAPAVQWLRKQPERFLATVQIGITVVGTAAAAIGGERLAHGIGQKLASVPVLGQWLSKAGLLIVVVGITVLEVVVGELVPKSLALRSPERYALAMGPVLRVMASVVKPAVWALTGLSNLVLKLFGDKTSFTETRLSPEELQELVEEAARTGSLDARSSEIASRAIGFRELTAFDVMVPRSRIVSVSRQASEDEVRKSLEGHRYARLPIYDGTPENVIGYLAVKDLFARRAPADSTGDARGDAVSGVLRAVQFVPETLPAGTLLRRMQREQAPLVIVVDEGGAVVGLVTIEDLVEEIVGDISSEQEAPIAPLVLDADRSVDLPGEMPIREVSRQLGLDLHEPEEYTTVAGLCIHLGREIPVNGATFTLHDGSTLTVLDATPRKVRLVRLRVAPEPVGDGT